MQRQINAELKWLAKVLTDFDEQAQGTTSAPEAEGKPEIVIREIQLDSKYDRFELCDEAIENTNRGLPTYWYNLEDHLPDWQDILLDNGYTVGCDTVYLLSTTPLSDDQLRDHLKRYEGKENEGEDDPEAEDAK